MKYRIAALWEKFRTAVIHPHAPDSQVKAMQMAFYGGVEAALNKLAGEVSAGDRLDDPSDEKLILEVNQELAEFAQQFGGR